MKYLFSLLMIIFTTTINAQQKEILIIGTMHTVPSIVKHSYAPLLKKAIDYQPDAILTEDIMPEDSISLINYTPSFLKRAEEALKESSLDENKSKQLQSKALSEMTHEDFMYLKNAFLLKKDRANYNYYSYLAEYGLKGSPKPLRNESDDVTHKLAIAMNIRQLLPIDNHHYDKEYNKAWGEAVNSGAENGDLKKYNSMEKKISSKQKINGMMGRLGRFTNKRSTLEHYYLTNSVRYADHPNEKTELAKTLWDERNQRMAENIIKQMNESSATRYVLIVGAGHVISLENAIKSLKQDIVIKTY